MTELIFALDVPDADEALKLVKLLGPEVDWFKIGLELYLKEGADIVRKISGDGKKVFLDLKLHDIPATVEKAALQVAGLGAAMMTVHASGGVEMMKAAMSAADKFSPKPAIIAVTVLTSIDAQTLRNIGIRRAPISLALDLAAAAAEAGVDGVVCSPNEIKRIKGKFGDRLQIVTPGIRLPDSKADDQKRTATPAQAKKRGADFIVVGRPIRTAADPVAVARKIKKMLK